MDGKEQKLKLNILKIKPTHVAQVCPTCRGFGTLKYGSKVCNGCNGKTYILIPAEEVK